MPLRSAQRSRLVDQVIDQLRAQISSGEWPVGTRIPPEPELVAQLDVGRNTVREAVRALAHAGLLECRQGAGTFVRTASDLSGAVRRRLAGAHLRDILEVRRALEVEAARLAAQRRTASDLEGLAAALHRRDEAWTSGEVEAFVEVDARFHQAVALAAHNVVLADLYGDFGDAVRASVRQDVDGLAPERFVDHAPVVEAIRAGDAHRAAQEASGYLNEGLRRATDE